MALTALICDADAAERAAIGDILRQLGFEILEAESGARAYELYQQHRPDAFMIANVVPGTYVNEFIRKIWALDRDAPVFVCAGMWTSVMPGTLKILWPYEPRRVLETLFPFFRAELEPLYRSGLFM